MSQYLVRRRRIVVFQPTNTRKHSGGGWLALGLIAAVAFVAANWNSISPPDSHTLVIHADHWNACYTEITIGNQKFPVLLDSGATGNVGLVFGSNHAAALGFSPRSLSFPLTYGSANGQGHATIVQVHDVRINGWPLGDVSTQITLAPQTEGLFGAQLLHRLNFHTEKGLCILSMPDAGS